MKFADLIERLNDEALSFPTWEQDLVDAFRDVEPTLEEVFSIYERFPDAIYGMPGALTRYLERQPGYQRILVEILSRKPVEPLLLMAYRRINGGDSDADELLELLKSLQADRSVPPDVAASIADYLSNL